MRHARLGKILEVGAAIVGSAQTVADHLAEFARENRVGNYLVMLKLGSMPRDLVEENVKRFAEGVLPRLRSIWSDQKWDHHWWPARLGGKPAAAGMKLAVPAEVRR